MRVEDLPRLMEHKPHRPEAGVYFEFDFIIEAITQGVGGSKERMFTILKEVCTKSSLHYVCPVCLEGFGTFERVRQHCEESTDHSHLGLSLKDQNRFIECYKHAIGRDNMDSALIPIEYDGYMNPRYHRCFDLDQFLMLICPDLEGHVEQESSR